MQESGSANSYSKTLEISLVAIYRKEASSIFSYFSRTRMKLVPIIGLDFSQANLTFDDDICLHRTKEDKPKVYLKILNKFIEAVSPISTEYSLPYAFG